MLYEVHILITKSLKFGSMMNEKYSVKKVLRNKNQDIFLIELYKTKFFYSLNIKKRSYNEYQTIRLE